jgi:hypothetical protein
MSSQAQILANRQNATRSTGPKTPEGKAASSANATRHGLAGIFNVLAHENREEFEQLAAEVREEFQPAGGHENFLVTEMIQARSKLLRLSRLEAAAMEQILTEPGSADDPDARILGAMSKTGGILDKLERYAAAARRCYHKAVRDLENGRRQKQQNEAKAFDAALKAYLYAPVPSTKRFDPPLQNEPDPAPRAAVRENLALRL